MDDVPADRAETDDSIGLDGETGVGASGATGQPTPSIERRSVPAVQRQTDSSMSTAEAEEFVPHYRDISTAGIEHLPTDVLIDLAQQEAKSLERHSKPALKHASAQVLLAYYEELRSRADTAPRAEDGTLLREGGLDGLVGEYLRGHRLSGSRRPREEDVESGPSVSDSVL